jgi:hypothetical protein
METAFHHQTTKGTAYKKTLINNTTPSSDRVKRWVPSLFFDHDSLHHALQHLVIELERLVPGELDVFGQVVGQNVDELAISALVEQGLVCKFCLLIRRARRSLRRRGGRRVVGECQVEV